MDTYLQTLSRNLFTRCLKQIAHFKNSTLFLIAINVLFTVYMCLSRVFCFLFI